MPFDTAIAICLFSLGIAITALGWNIYRDVVLKPRVTCSVAVMVVVDGKPQVNRLVKLTATNHGPGPVELVMVAGRIAPLWKRITRRSEHIIVKPDLDNPKPSLPARLDVGESVHLLFPFRQSNFLSDPITHIGVFDSFGRSHYATRSNIKSAREQFLKHFPESSTGTD